jgi:copper(I)-binding protein
MSPFLAALPLLLATTWAQVPPDRNLGAITADHGTIVYAPIGGATKAFMNIQNSGTEPDTLTGLDCPIADTTSLVGPDGKPATSLVIPPGKTVVISKDGPMLDLQSVHFIVTYGSVVPCMLTFSNAGQIQILLYSVPASKK